MARKSKPPRFTRDKRGKWTWHLDRPYKGVRIDVHMAAEYNKGSSTIKTGSIRYYVCLARGGASKLGPMSSHPAVFVNCADHGKSYEFKRRADAQRQALEWVDAGWPCVTAASLAKWEAMHGRAIAHEESKRAKR